jgi:hypothetical protein
MLRCKDMGHISRDCPNRDAMGRPSLRQETFADNKRKGRVNLVEFQDKTRRRRLQILTNLCEKKSM